MIAHGEIVAEGTPDTIAGRDHMTTHIRFALSRGAPEPPPWGQTHLGDGRFGLEVADPTTTLHMMTSWALEHGTAFDLIGVERPSLEDVYLELTGGEETAP